MLHFLALLNDNSLQCFYFNKTLALCPYKGEQKVSANNPDDFWEEFWEHLIDVAYGGTDHGLGVTCLYAGCSFQRARNTTRYLLDREPILFQLQEFSTILPELMLKKGLLPDGEARFTTWKNLAWKVTREQARSIDGQNKHFYKLKAQDIAEAFFASWPTHKKAKLNSVPFSSTGHGDLARYVETSKIGTTGRES